MKAAALVALLALAAPLRAATPDDLLEAERRGDVGAVKAALDAGIPVDTPFRYDRTALSFAAGHSVEIVKLLLYAGPLTEGHLRDARELGGRQGGVAMIRR